MKKKNILISGLATALTAVIIYVSGGSIIIATILGGAVFCTIPGILNSNTTGNKNNISYAKQIENTQNYTENIDFIEEEKLLINQEKKEVTNIVSIIPNNQYKDNEKIIPKLITTDALSQQEEVLVRRRKKETKENYRKKL